MKKLALVIAVVFIAAFFVTPVTASDFSAGGSYRFEAVSKDPGAGEKSEYFDQRMRVSFKWAVNDNVSAELRGDFAESTWGANYRPAAGHDTIMIDRATVNIKQGPLKLAVGIIEPNQGLGTIWSYQMQGIQADFAMNPLTLSLYYGKEAEGLKTDDGANDDTNLYAASLNYGSDVFSGGIHYATLRDEATNADKNGLGVHFVLPIGVMTLQGELVTFDGDVNATTEWAGTQFHATLSAPFSETIKGGVTVLWADDVDSNETQATDVQDDANFVVLDFAGALGYNNLAPGCSVFAPAGAAAGAGAMGIVGNIQFAASEALTLYGKLGYIEPKEDALTNLDSKFYAIANADYAWMPAVTLSAGISYVSPDYDDGSADDAEIVTTFQLGVSF